ncbi:MAG: hypothetical protein LC674_01990, partial [Actinobacteria bacterium]|nr:hypothetical protein [Actinomycetota bacterium]
REDNAAEVAHHTPPHGDVRGSPRRNRSEVLGWGGTLGAKIGAMALATLAIGMAACGGDDGDNTTAPEAANEKAR